MSINVTCLSGSSWNNCGFWESSIDRFNQERPENDLHLFVNFIAPARPDQIDSWIPYEELDQTISSNHGKRLVFVLDSHTEGASFNHVRETVLRLQTEHGIQPRNIIHWTGSRPDGSEPINVLQNLYAFSLISNTRIASPTLMPTHHFVMLARVARPHRVNAAVEILRRHLDAFGRMSCGCIEHDEPVNQFNLVPHELKNRFPLVIDGFFKTKDQEIHADDVLRLPEVTGAFCQLIGESSHESQDMGWTAPFPTEKTEKCFLLGQVPIFNGPRYLVRNIRELGFDLFDDLIDHSYDDEPDTSVRLGLVMDQLERICHTPLDTLIRYKLDNVDRFDDNRKLCYDIRSNLNDMHYYKLRDCLNDIIDRGTILPILGTSP